MSQPLAEGIWPATIQSASFGENDRGVPQVQINARIDDGPSKGRQCTYEDEVNSKSALYVGRSCRAVGWKGASLLTLKDDVSAWVIATGGKSSVEVRHVEIKRGKKFNEWVEGGQKGPPPIWDKVNSIGRGPKPLTTPKGETLTDANDAMRRAMEADGFTPGNVGGGGDDPPPVANDDDLPFATCSRVGLGEIAKVLR
jgi:hypothetical protein